MKNIFPINIILRQIYILQLENFDLKRFSSLIFSSILKRTSKPRRDIIWTPKLIIISILATLIYIVIPLLFLWGEFPITLSALLVIIALVLLSPLFFLFLALTTLIFYPADSFAKDLIIRKATKKLQELKDIKVIAITGSYGKTTMKDIITTVLSVNFEVVSTSENQNTPLGISRQILREIDETTEIFVVEMGAYTKSDITKLCNIARPNISVLVGINEAHLERFGSLENTIETKFEIISNCLPDGIIVLNADDRFVVENLEKFKGNQIIYFFSSQNNDRSKYKFTKKDFRQDGSGISFQLAYEGREIGNIKTPFLADYIIGDVVASFIIGAELGMSESEIRIGLENLKVPEHRLQSTRTPDDIVVIDDSYNGNPKGAEEAINVLSQFTKRRKIYVTPGLVETGEAAQEVHKQIGLKLATVADIVVLVKNSVTDFIIGGLKEGGFEKSHIKTYVSAKRAHDAVGRMAQSGDVILFQNDWSDNYM